MCPFATRGRGETLKDVQLWQKLLQPPQESGNGQNNNQTKGNEEKSPKNERVIGKRFVSGTEPNGIVGTSSGKASGCKIGSTLKIKI